MSFTQTDPLRGDPDRPFESAYVYAYNSPLRGSVATTRWSAIEPRSCVYSAADVYTGMNASSGPRKASNTVHITTDQVGRGFNVGITYKAVIAAVPNWAAPDMYGWIGMSIQSGKLNLCRDRDAFPSLGIFRIVIGQSGALLEDAESRLGPAVLSGLGGADTGCREFDL